jgi:hypothetical protein
LNLLSATIAIIAPRTLTYPSLPPHVSETTQRKTDRLDLGPTDIFGKSFATGGYQDPLDYDDISPVGVIPAKAGDEITIQWDHHWPQGHPGVSHIRIPVIASHEPLALTMLL